MDSSYKTTSRPDQAKASPRPRRWPILDKSLKRRPISLVWHTMQHTMQPQSPVKGGRRRIEPPAGSGAKETGATTVSPDAGAWAWESHPIGRSRLDASTRLGRITGRATGPLPRLPPCIDCPPRPRRRRPRRWRRRTLSKRTKDRKKQRKPASQRRQVVPLKMGRAGRGGATGAIIPL